MAELKEEIKKYYGKRTTNRYKNIQSMMIKITREMKVLVVTSAANIALKEKYNTRLAQLWTKFESRANTLVEELELQVGGGGTSGKSSSHSDTRKQVEMYLKSKMESYHMGEFIIRKK